MSVQDIYNKLRTAPEFHPASADLFDDFTIEAGDVISVASDSEHYALPVFAQHMVWNGSAMVTVQSQGDKERKPLPVLQRKLFASGRGAYVSDLESEEKFKRFERFIESTDERFSYLMTESEWDDAAQEAHVTMQSQVTMTARELSTTVAKTGINNLGQGETLYSQIVQNAQAITTKVSAGDIASTINQTAQSVLIQASKIDLQGYVTASQLSAVEADITNLTTGVTLASALKASTLQASNAFFMGNTQADWRTIKIGSVKSFSVLGSLPSALEQDFDHYHAITATEGTGADAGKIFLTLGAAQSSAGSANFNIAATQTYIDGVAAAYQEGYADGIAHGGTAPTVVSVVRDSTRQTTYANAIYTVPVIITFSDNSTQNSTVNISITTGSYNASTKRYPINVAGCTTRSLDATTAYNAGRDDNAGIQSLTMLSVTQDAYENGIYASVTQRSVTTGRYYVVTANPKYGTEQRFKFHPA